jgi:hypothetical protein
VGKRRFAGVRIEKDMQVMFITLFLSIIIIIVILIIIQINIKIINK